MKKKKQTSLVKKLKKRKDSRTLCNINDPKEMALWVDIAKAALKPGTGNDYD